MDTLNREEITPLIAIHGIPAFVRDKREPYQKRLAIYIILASVVFERIAFYLLAATLTITADTQQCPSTKGPIITFIFTGTSNISTLIFGVFSDWRIGRAKTIIIGFVLYILGYLMAIIFTSGAIEACNNIPDGKTIFDQPCFPWILPAIVIVSIGAGAVQANIAVFGCEQIQEFKITSRYFDKYVLAVNIGAIFADASFYYAQRHNYIAYIYAASALFVATLLFIFGRRYYIHVKPAETVVTKCIPVTINAFQSWYQYRKRQRSTNTTLMLSSGSNSSNTSRRSHHPQGSFMIHERPSTFLDFAKLEYHGNFLDRIVDDVKSLRGAIVVFALLIPYWLVYDQLNSTFRLQAQYMRGTEVTPMVLMSLVDPVILIIGILLLLLFLYKYLDARNKSLTIVNKFVIGMSVSVITMIIAGIVEKVRQDEWKQGHNLSDLNIGYQIPQGLCMGVSEIFMMVASFEYAYFAAPRSAQTLFMSLRFFSIGISSFLGAAYISLFTKNESTLDFSCVPDEDMKWRFYTYFFVLGGIQFIFIIIFIVLQKIFHIIKINRQQIGTKHLLVDNQQ